MHRAPARKWSTIVRPIITTLSVLVLVAVTGDCLYSAYHSQVPNGAMVDTGAPDQYADSPSDTTWDNVPGNVANALRYCPGSDIADVTQRHPCLNGVLIADLNGSALTVVQPFSTYSMSIGTQQRMTLGGVDTTITTVAYSTGTDFLFAAAMRMKTSGDWSGWTYVPNLATYPFLTALSDYQIALFGYNAAHQTQDNPAVSLPQAFSWNQIMPQILPPGTTH